MRRLIHLSVAACLMCGMLIAFPACSQGDRIEFVGAVVVPTCTTPFDVTALAASKLPSVHAFTCGGARVQGVAAADASTYRLSVVRLDHATTAGFPLLRYFADYCATAHAAAAQMVTRTYE